MLTAFDVQTYRDQFPILDQTVHGRPLVYLDNAATTQKPDRVIRTVTEYYRSYNSNIHRAAHALADKATARYEEARESARRFIHAADVRSVLFTRGTTEGINLVASSWGSANVKAGDEILITGMEHHSNIVPWQLLCERTGATLKVVPVLDDGSLDMEAFADLLNERTRMVSFVWISNALGTINPAETIISMAHDAGATVLVDAAQAGPHHAIDVQALDCDFLTFSGHKTYGPTGIGILYGRPELLEAMPPYHGGGEMIAEVSFEKTTYNDIPYKFEAGTPNIAGAIGLGAALNFLLEADLDAIAEHEQVLLDAAVERLSAIDGLRFIGEAPERAGAVSFLIGDTHPYDLGILLDKQGVAVRTGHHCCQPLMRGFGIEGTCRASFGLYNTLEDVERLGDAVQRAATMLQG